MILKNRKEKMQYTDEEKREMAIPYRKLSFEAKILLFYLDSIDEDIVLSTTPCNLDEPLEVREDCIEIRIPYGTKLESVIEAGSPITILGVLRAFFELEYIEVYATKQAKRFFVTLAPNGLGKEGIS